MSRLFREISNWGIPPDTPPLQAPHLRLSNVFLSYMFVASIAQTLLCLVSGALYPALLNSTAPLVFGIGLLLMRARRTVAARVFVFAVCSSVGYVFIASVGPDAGFQYVFLFASALAIGMFSLEERSLLAFGILAPLVSFIALEVTHYESFFVPRAALDPEHLALLRLFSIIVVWSLMVAHFLYFVYTRQRSQEQLINSAKMVALGRMAAGIAHEVNNPLQLIMSYAEKMKSTTDVDEIRKRSEQIQSVAMRIATINKGLLTLSRDAKADPLVAISLRSVVDLALEFCRARFESKKIELRVREIPGAYTVSGRETQLAEVLLNVLTNAHDAVESSPERWVEVSVDAHKQWLDITVTDSGGGVRAEHLGRIFDPFFTTKPVGRGTGLGLSICRAVMTDHGGDIFYDRKRDRSSFVIRIPRVPEAESPVQASVSGSSSSSSETTV